MYETAVLVTAMLMLISAVDYVRRAKNKETSPVPATWVLMMVMMTLSCWMYWQSPSKSWTGNIAVPTGALNVVYILYHVIQLNRQRGTLTVAFDRVQRLCLVGGAGVVVFWFITKNALTSYILVQCIGLIAYVATARRLWNAERVTEPLFFWVCVLSANLCALYPAWVRDDTFSWIYLARTIPTTFGMILLIARAQRRMMSRL